MPELIDRKYLLAYLAEIKPDEYVSAFGEAAVQVIGLIEEFVKEMPTIDAKPVRLGRWIDAHFVSGGDFHHCSECGCYIEKTFFANDYNVRYCPACGARMDGGADNADN